MLMIKDTTQMTTIAKLNYYSSLSRRERNILNEQRRKKRQEFLESIKHLEEPEVVPDPPEDYDDGGYVLQPPNVPRKRGATFKRFTREQVAIAKLNGIDYDLLYRRVVTKGMRFEDAINEPITNFNKEWTDDEIHLMEQLLMEGKSSTQIHRHLDRSYHTVKRKCVEIRKNLRARGLIE